MKRGYTLIVFLLVIFVIEIAGATVTINSPISNSNHSRTMNVSISNSGVNVNSSEVSYNVTLYCNKSGGSVEERLATDIITTIWNSTDTATIFENATLNSTSLTEAFRLYNCSAYADNSTDYNWSVAVKNITIDNTPPAVSFSGITTVINNGNYSGSITLNVSASDSLVGMGSVYFNVSNSTNQIAFLKATASGSYYNVTMSTGSYSDGKYNITVWANDTQLNNLNNTEKIQVVIDNNAPVVTFSCSPTSVNTNYPVTCSCSGAAASGINSTTYTVSPSTETAGTFTETCVVTSFIGNSTTSTFNYTVNSPGGIVSTGGSTSTATAINSWTRITPGTTAVIKDFNKDVCVRQIQIEVNNEAQNVQITINKYSSKPSNISVEKSNNYNYFSIDTKNLEENMSKATIEIQVNKSWVAENNFNREDIALFKYDESADKWDEIITTFNEEDSIYYYYNAEVASFSYFAIAPKEQSPVTEEQQIIPAETETEKNFFERLSIWVWIVILAVILLGCIVFFIIKRGNRTQRKKSSDNKAVIKPGKK